MISARPRVHVVAGAAFIDGGDRVVVAGAAFIDGGARVAPPDPLGLDVDKAVRVVHVQRDGRRARRDADDRRDVASSPEPPQVLHRLDDVANSETRLGHGHAAARRAAPHVRQQHPSPQARSRAVREVRPRERGHRVAGPARV